MVGRKGRGDYRSRHDLPIDDPGPFDDAAEAHQSDLRRIDDPENRLDSLIAETGDGDRPAGQIG